MATVEEGLQAQIRNIEATYGKPMSHWLAIIAASGLTKHNDVVGMLKADYGMTMAPPTGSLSNPVRPAPRRPPLPVRQIQSAPCIRGRRQFSARCTMP
jgi:hypothetical protein